MTSYVCPKGHPSREGDFCDTCGTRISGSAPTTVVLPSTPSAQVTGQPSMQVTGPPTIVPCPNCGTPRTAMWRFCEECGYDHNTGRVPEFAAPPPVTAGPPGQWTATVFADRTYFDANVAEGVVFPADAPERTVVLPAPQVRIGRSSSSAPGPAPDLDLSTAPADPGVSHNHALLTLSVDGVWLVSDLNSTNGTYVNDEERPLTAGQSRALKDGDQVHVGVWTTIALHAP
ncbi:MULTISPECIES: FHA domain-containing protein [Actinoplanes]|uniref:FHA domain-containing protein n=1 Tax=Actinoplanes TaxID=1865 RepID=UPI0005F28B2C|nr:MULTISPECIES: FHA domain-containing protein [Actinoplanes]GLY00171.1 hypothetical protein Acsp01_05500 [Actinoplanes sp. NBRC 101535]